MIKYYWDFAQKRPPPPPSSCGWAPLGLLRSYIGQSRGEPEKKSYGGAKKAYTHRYFDRIPRATTGVRYRTDRGGGRSWYLPIPAERATSDRASSPAVMRPPDRA
jgi:hypothetical protein